MTLPSQIVLLQCFYSLINDFLSRNIEMFFSFRVETERQLRTFSNVWMLMMRLDSRDSKFQ